uniref:Large ribosomal subunit protein uL23c n=1 Tax=Mastocarpus papillatus TaxID=31436 RepID=A0A342RZH7_9FLOR|nr:ribosomal protein L23 [Mastocarpus papillatus]AOL58123.1 ribosomal protein L23 [Mastocarpus papillatus]
MPNTNKRKLLNIIKYPIITDKTTKLLEDNQYSFAVDSRANKLDIKKAIEYIFDVCVININTCNTPPNKKRVGKFTGKKANHKKAIVKLSPEYNINLFPDN